MLSFGRMALHTLLYKTEGKHRGSFNLENRRSDLTVFLLATFPALKSVCSASKVSPDDAFDYTIFAICICMVPYLLHIYKYVSSTFPKKENYLSFVLQWTIFSRNMSNFHYLSAKLDPDVVCFINSPRLKFKLKLKRFWIWSHCENSNFGRESLFVV